MSVDSLFALQHINLSLLLNSYINLKLINSPFSFQQGTASYAINKNTIASGSCFLMLTFYNLILLQTEHIEQLYKLNFV
jgi:hypothetical protein